MSILPCHRSLSLSSSVTDYAVSLLVGGFTFSGEGESMIHNAAGSFARLAMTDASNPPSRRSSGAEGVSMRQVEDEWEDER